MSESLNDKELQAFANDLQHLVPVAPALDRDRLMFRAGQESVRKQRGFWMASSAMLAAGLAGVSALLLWHLQFPPAERVRVVIVERQVPAPRVQEPTNASAPSQPPARAVDEERPESLAYLELRQQMLRGGVVALPSLPQAPPRDLKQSGQPDNLLALHTPATPRSFLQWFTGQSGENE